MRLKRNQLHVWLWGQKEKEQWGIIPAKWNWTLNLDTFLPYSPPGPHRFLSRASQATPASTYFSWFPVTNVKMIPGAADQSAGVCELQRRIDTAAGPWARGQGGRTVWNAWAIPWEQQNGKGTNKPSRVLEGVLLFRQQKFSMPKQSGSIKWAPGVWKLQA